MKINILPDAIFLDRDGVVNQSPKEGEYIVNWKDFHFKPDFLDFAKKWGGSDIQFFLVTNQQCIGKGQTSIDEVNYLHSKMNLQLKDLNFEFSQILVCPHLVSESCNCRKPKPGMINFALQKYSIDPDNSVLIGDRASDIQAASRAGLKYKFLLNTVNLKREQEKLENKFNYKKLNSLSELSF